jgi:hypothetical protein
MFNIFTAARSSLIALAVASPVAALAQTPHDVANLVWQQNVPAYVSAAPTASIFAGAGSAADVARLVQSSDVSGYVSKAPSSDTVFANSFGGQDLARLSGISAPSLFVIRDNGITVAEGTHN